jgi:CubicO group peptidase (beta-lactamase class C family)
MDKRAITVRQLLAHLSGLDQTYASEGLADRGEAVRHMLGMPLIDKPGHKFHYSNDNYELTAAIIEVVSGEDYRNFVQEELWRPVGMRETGFSNMPAAKEVVPTKNTLPPRVLNIARGEAGVYSTTRDLFVWYRALRAGRVLTRADTDALFTPVAPIGEGKAALGWFIGKTAAGIGDIFTRGNEDFGANSLLYAYPHRDVVVVVLTHAGTADGEISWSRAVLKKIEAILFSADERGKR